MSNVDTPVAWYFIEDPWGAHEWHWLYESPEKAECDPADWTPVYSAKTIERIGRERDAEVALERGRVEALSFRVRDMEARYMALLKVVADGVAMQPKTIWLPNDDAIRTTKD
jgi:hypothetical protein